MTAKSPFASALPAALPAALVLALFWGLAACALPEKAEAPGYEWRWTGAGRPANFTADRGACRRTVNTVHRLERRAPSHRVSRKPPRDPFAQRLPFRQCMKGRGWSLARK